ncbi:MAG: hypothetical protein E7253_05305 [Lachnospiraceae bacterium]|nr:hypothetical protein [Lachnospiraceae bacterium]
MEDNKKKKRRAYLDDFRKTGGGEYEYKGAQYIWEGSKEEFRKQIMVIWGYAALMAVCIIGAGCLPVPSMINCVYVILPFTVCFICAVSVIWGICRLTYHGSSLRAYVYDATVEQVPMRAVGTIVGAGGTIAGELIYLVKNGFGEAVFSSVLFILLLAGAMAVLTFLRVEMLKMKWIRGV